MARLRLATAVVMALALAGGAWFASGGRDDGDATAATPGGPSAADAIAIGPQPVSPAMPAALALRAPARAGMDATEEALHRAGFTAQWLAAHGFSSPEALRGLEALLDPGRELPGAPRQTLAIRPSGANAGEVREAVRLAAAEGYVIADLAAPLDLQGDAVLVRWRRQGDGQVLGLAPQAASVPGQAPQFWMYKPQGWEPGSYRLEVVSANPRLEVLAAASFEIVAPGSRIDAFAHTAQAVARP